MNINELTDEEKLHTLHALLLWYAAENEGKCSPGCMKEMKNVAEYVLQDALAGGVQ